ncbi:MAG: sarcosine oxidase subunit gamma family protein [Pseudomonadota bacterium]
MVELPSSSAISACFKSRLSSTDTRGVYIPARRDKIILRTNERRGHTSFISENFPTLPQKPLTFSHCNGVDAYWLGPNEWLLAGHDLIRKEFGSDDVELRNFDRVALVDVSHQFVEIRVGGARARDTLKSFVPLDIDPRAFPEGSVSRTAFAKSEAIIIHERAPDLFVLLVQRSFADYFLGLICRAGAEFGLGLSTNQ